MATEPTLESTTSPSINEYVNDAEAPPANIESNSRSIVIHRGRPGGVALEDQFNENKIETNDESVAGSVDSEDEALDPIELPQSTHSLLFSQPVFSIPFGFALAITLLSFACLTLAFWDGLNASELPVNVTPAVKMAQYLAIVIALLMEEEIPTGFYLLRMIPRYSLHQRFPRIKYNKFVFSSCIRILNGYYFLANVMLVLVTSTGVLGIFYDVLALQFVQQLDDIAFALAKMDVFGKDLQRACTAKCFRTEFGQKREGRNKYVSKLLKGLTAFNFIGMLTGMAYFTFKQTNGDYYTSSINVKFGSSIWLSAWAKFPSSSDFEEQTLIYSFFNGVYTKNHTESGRPVYLEVGKYDGRPYEVIKPAFFKYCKEISAWVFMHQDIKKLNSSEPGCKSNWLLRSPPTYEHDLLSVIDNWQVWVGSVGKAEIDIVSNICEDETDCNLNGLCINGKCQCNEKKDTKYFGTHCEVTLPNSCETIISDPNNVTWQVQYYDPDSRDGLVKYYSRPAYYMDGTTNTSAFFIYLGDRWYSAAIPKDPNFQPTPEYTKYFVENVMSQEHAFWNKRISAEEFRYVSEPTTSSTPVGVDIYEIIARGSEQYGPLGVLQPVAPNGQVGKGYFRCGGPANSTATIRRLQYHAMFGHERSD